MLFLTKYFNNFQTDQAGFIFMWGLCTVFVLIVGIAIERGYYVYLRSNINAPKFMNEISRLVNAGDLKKAISLCKSAGNRALALVFLRALEVTAEREVVDFRAVQNAVDEATLELIPKLTKRTNFLAMLANTSVLFGLMGTIYGLILSFENVGSDTAALGMGISTAMFTTLGGLINAIPGMVLHSIISTKTSAIIDDIDEYSVKLIHLLTAR